ncbi:hypothetical protein CLOM_g5966 [Closterium sp. NIES-68]|nr:hypothetical protein CLOM_g5966 [Closterium sp. NIES-68]
MVAATSTLHLEMTTLDNLLPSSHPLRLSRMVREGVARSNSLGAGALTQDRIQGQMKLVERLQKESLWCEDFDKSVLLLAAAVVILSRRLRLLFGSPEVDAGAIAHTLGECGLALHYAHTLLLVERIVSKPTALLRAQRDDLYRRLPANVQQQVRVRLKQRSRPFDIEAAAEIRRTLEYMLGWLLPMAHCTITWQTEHSYGCHLSKRHRTLQVQTLYYADKDRFEVCLVELLVGLSYISRPPGLTNLQPGEEASWRLWLTSGGHIPPVGADGAGAVGGEGMGRVAGEGGEMEAAGGEESEGGAVTSNAPTAGHATADGDATAADAGAGADGECENKAGVVAAASAAAEATAKGTLSSEKGAGAGQTKHASVVVQREGSGGESSQGLGAEGTSAGGVGGEGRSGDAGEGVEWTQSTQGAGECGQERQGGSGGGVDEALSKSNEGDGREGSEEKGG